MPDYPPKPESITKTLSSVEEFSKEFSKLWNQMKKEFFKYERLQSYQEPDNPSWQSFIKGKKENIKEKFTEHIYKEDKSAYTDMCKKEIKSTRIRYIELPLTDYLRWELQTYEITAKFGERILILESHEEEFSKTSDFLIFDKKSVLVHRYNSSGILEGGWLITDSKQVKKYLSLAQKAIRNSVPLGVFEKEKIN